MNTLRGILIAQFVGLLVYTILTVADHGWILFEVFLGDIMALNWSGQFNLDFSCYLLLSGIWIAWRERFSAFGILYGLAAAIIGIILFAPYVLWASVQAKGDLKEVLMGRGR
ncbi:MAG: hypothetical protein AAFP02_01515 [Bacteroidota bacterium]